MGYRVLFYSKQYRCRNKTVGDEIMLDKERCKEWSKAMLALIKITQDLSDDEAEYIMQNLKIEHAKLKIEELEDKNRI